MSVKPKHLSAERAAAFQDRSVVEAYPHRPPYPAEVFEILHNLITHKSGAVLDVGCGTGDIARQLVSQVERVDAVDWSAGMIEKGKTLPVGNHPNLRWIHGRAEEATLYPPYGLITAGETLHWMDWEVVLPRFRAMLSPHGYVAIVERKALPPVWHVELQQLIPRFSTNPDYQPVDLIGELERRGLFKKIGEARTTPVPFIQSVTDYIEAFHSMSSFSRERMGREQAMAFDAALKALLSDACEAENVALQIEGGIVWGIPTGDSR
jgi:ubiquinone/menaquinone biosynthesis C-methylase UbiE